MLRDATARTRLIEALSEVQRLVLLGDVIELRQAPVRNALAAARPVLAEIGAAIGADGEVVIVPGNHDHHLLSSWLERSSRDGEPPPLNLEHPVDWRSEDPLGELAEALAPARVRASYPGVWLRDDLYATHGHYLDRHTTVPMLEHLAAGAMARIVGEPKSQRWRAEDYEAILTPIYAWIHAVAQRGVHRSARPSQGVSGQAWRTIRAAQRGRHLRAIATATGFDAVIKVLSRTPLGPLRSDLSTGELRRAALLAFGEVLLRLGVQASYVIFGHTHRAGPLPGDDEHEWVTGTGAMMMNTGSWIIEPLVTGARQVSPYRPGFCAVVEDAGAPTLQNLLDEPPTPARA